MISTASIIGTGNVASQLVLLLKKNGINIDSIFGRNTVRTQKLAELVGAVAISNVSSHTFNSDIIIIAISDNGYQEIISHLNISPSSIVVHTSGSISMHIFESFFDKYGVLYPIQTFSEGRWVDMQNVPICIEASSDKVYQEMATFANKFSNNIHNINSTQRMQLHIAAIFCCNFVNYLYSCASDMLKTSKIPIDILNPLIIETAEKAIQLGAENVQTGPAKRGDLNVIAAHSFLIENPKFKELYALLSSQILNKYNA